MRSLLYLVLALFGLANISHPLQGNQVARHTNLRRLSGPPPRGTPPTRPTFHSLHSYTNYRHHPNHTNRGQHPNLARITRDYPAPNRNSQENSQGHAYGGGRANNRGYANNEGHAYGEGRTYGEGRANNRGYANNEGHAYGEGRTYGEGRANDRGYANNEGHAYGEGRTYGEGRANDQGHASDQGHANDAAGNASPETATSWERYNEGQVKYEQTVREQVREDDLKRLLNRYGRLNHTNREPRPPTRHESLDLANIDMDSPEAREAFEKIWGLSLG